MTFELTVLESLARARADLRMGVPVVFYSGDHRVIAAAAETLSPDRLNAFRRFGQPVLALTKRRAETLKARCYDGDIARIKLPADATVAWVKALADPADDLNSPLKGPLIATRTGDATLHRVAINLIKSARLLPATLVVEVSAGDDFSTVNGLTRVDIDQAAPLLAGVSPLREIINARVPLAVSADSKLHVFRPEDGGEEHYAIEIGRPDRSKPVLVRLHSACFTGDLIGSLKCDCGPQLRCALSMIGDAGAGVLLYLNQEGRGIGLANKMRAYSLQDQGFDTVEANHRLGFEDDERDFRIGARILSGMGITATRLLTNNPAKVTMMQANGIEVTERVPLIVGQNPLNAEYLKTKAEKSGHLF